MMTRKDYVRAAEIVREVQRNGTKSQASAVRQAFSSFFRGDNPRFDADRFLAACELKPTDFGRVSF